MPIIVVDIDKSLDLVVQVTRDLCNMQLRQCAFLFKTVHRKNAENEEQGDAVASILVKWNPLGAAAQDVPHFTDTKSRQRTSPSGSRYEADPCERRHSSPGYSMRRLI